MGMPFEGNGGFEPLRLPRIDPVELAKLPERERQKVAAELDAVQKALEQNPLLGYGPHGKQVAFHSPPFPRSRLFLGGNRSGKTTAAMVDTILQAVDRDFVPRHLQSFKRWDPPFYARVVIPDLTRSLEGVTLQKFREWCPKSQLKGSGFVHAWDKQQIMLRFKNGSWVQFMSNDQDLDKFGGAALHRVVYDEEPRQDIRRECLMRLIDYAGEELYGMTPLHGMSWVYDEFFEPWERGLVGDDVRIVVVDMDDNPHLDEATKSWVLRGLSSEERQARKSGRFVAFAGLIYPEFSPSRHVVPDPSRLSDGVEVFVGIDPGYRHLCAVLFGYLDQNDEMVIFDEVTMQAATVQQVAEEVKNRLMFKWGSRKDDGTLEPLQPRWFVIDPASRNKNTQTGRSDQQEFADHGIFTIPGQNDVRPGINRVKERLAADKLKFAASCRELQAEFKKYRWVRDSSRSEDDPRERPVKKDDHCFPAGTLVDTAIGRRPIEAVRPGELIWTRRGLFPAVRAGLTRRDVETCMLALEDGRELAGTPNHPVYVADRGWTPLGSVRYGDIMLVWPEGAKRSPGTESSSTATPTPSRQVPATTSPPRPSDCIGPSGNSIMAQSPRDATCITSMATRPTTTFRISSASRPEPISLSTGLLSGVRNSDSGWSTLCVRPLLLGTAHQMDWCGIGSTQGACSATECRDHTSVTSVALSSRASSAGTCASVPLGARPHGGEPLDSMMLTEPANGAAWATGATDTPRPRLVPLRVVENSPGSNVAVYNLTVLGPPEYFANGILVHNCLDALRYMVMQRPLAPEADRPKPTDTTRDRLLRHHLRRWKPRLPDAGMGPGQFQ